MSTWVAGILAAALLVAPPVLAAAQPQGATAQDEFVPLKEVPAAEQLPAAPLVVGAYAFIWVALLGYVVVLWRKLAAVQREIAGLQRRVGGGEGRS